MPDPCEEIREAHDHITSPAVLKTEIAWRSVAIGLLIFLAGIITGAAL